MSEFAKTARKYAETLRAKAKELDRLAEFSVKFEGGRVHKGWPKGKKRKPVMGGKKP